MKQTLALLLTAFTLSFAACTKSDNNNSFIPTSSLDIAHFKGDMNDDQLTLISFTGDKLNLIYKGRSFTGPVLQENSSFSFNITDGLSTATGKVQIPLVFYTNIYPVYVPSYIQFDPGTIFESSRYTLIN